MIEEGTVEEIVDLSEDELSVKIEDALTERDWVKFTVLTQTKLPYFNKPKFSVIRLHEEFIWLHDTFNENPDYAGFVIPPPPPMPDFDNSREKLRKLSEMEGTLQKDEFQKMRHELEAEYLATFKKTVASHEAFLLRLTSHSVFRHDRNLHIFLKYDQELNVRGKNAKEKMLGLFSSLSKSGDEILLSNTIKDVDNFFENERNFLNNYFNHLRDATSKSDKMTAFQKTLADNYIKISLALLDLSSSQNDDLSSFLRQLGESMEKMRRIEARVASDQDLKLSDTLRYHMRDSSSAKDLLFRRLRCLANYENANKNLDKARGKNKNVVIAETEQGKACSEFEAISEKAKEELKILKTRRLLSFRKSLVELAELECKHANAHAEMLKATILSLKRELPL